MTIQEAKTIIDKLSSRDDSNKSNSEKRAKVLNSILKGYHIQIVEGVNPTSYTLEDIGYLLNTSKQYVTTIESKALNKLTKKVNYETIEEIEKYETKDVFSNEL